ncbi:Small subunit (SSU) processome component, variant 2 [Bonamia ostreae]|uniref:Small subunit (SSU) processome component, variant 2 n=1 Tax=Bonamia ostreae TaxID=126728 RepID=A0ABV2AGL6_9EUKA
MRKLKHHEKKLLKKVNLYDWKSDDNVREVRILRRYRIQNREDYVSYNRLTGKIRKLSAKLKLLDETDIIRKKITKELLLKLFALNYFKLQFGRDQNNQKSGTVRQNSSVGILQTPFASHNANEQDGRKPERSDYFGRARPF